MKALVLLYGRVPFLHGSKIEDIAKLHSPLKNDMLGTIQAIPWAAKELNMCFMRSAGETDAKPAIDAAAKSLESDSLDEQSKGLRDVISGTRRGRCRSGRLCWKTLSVARSPTSSVIESRKCAGPCKPSPQLR